MLRQQVRLIGFLAIIIALLIASIHISFSQTKRKYSWRLTGKEILLQLEHRRGKHPPGIYAFDPFRRSSRLQLLIPGGERPVWSLTRKFFAYLKGEYLCVVRSDGSEEKEIAYSLADFDYHFHDPTVIWNWQDEYAVVERNSSFGSVVLMGGSVEPFPESPSPSPGTFIVPSPRRISGESKEEGIKWNELLTTNNPTFSPDGKYMAAEVYPAPMDLRRSQSRILIYEFPAESEEPELWWFLYVQVFKGPGRRLTSITGENCELMPLWSPTGEWIAFSLVDFKGGFIAPVVVRPDGSDMKMLLPEEECYFWSSKEWKPIGKWLTKAWHELVSPPYSWGYPDITPVEWSPDGKYLLLNKGKRFTYLMVAKWEDKKWMGRGTWGQSNGLRFATWGPKGPWFAYIPSPRASLEEPEVIILKNVETLEEIEISLDDPNWVVRYMDW